MTIMCSAGKTQWPKFFSDRNIYRYLAENYRWQIKAALTQLTLVY